jgi:uroporphyrinogen III methyltransferase/synthase
MPAGEARPLNGRGILITRPRDRSAEMTAQLESLGAIVHALPAIELHPLAVDPPWSERLRDRWDWIVLTSANAARIFLASVGEVRLPEGARIAAIGPSTAKALEEGGVKVDLVPPVYRAESLVSALEGAGVAGRSVLLPRALKARDVLPERLGPVVKRLDVVPIYETRAADGAGDRLRALADAGALDAVTFLSSSAVESFHEMLTSPPSPNVVYAAIGPVTADTARALGYEPVVVAREATVAGLVDALVQHYSRG